MARKTQRIASASGVTATTAAARFFVAAALAGGLCFVGGFAIAKISRPDPMTIGDRTSSGPAGASQAKQLTAITPGTAGAGASRQLAKLAKITDIGFYARMCAYFKLVSQAEVAEIPDLMASVTRNVSDDLGRDALLNVLANRWAQLDPQGAYQALLDGEPLGIDRASGKILMTLAKTDPRGAWQKLLDADGEKTGILGNNESRMEFVRDLISAIGAEDAGIAAELIEATGSSQSFAASFANAYVLISRSNPEGLLDNIDRLSFGSTYRRASTIGMALGELAAKSPAAALARLVKLGGIEHKRAATEIAQKWGRSEPLAAMDWANGLEGSSRMRAQTGVLRQMSNTDPAAAAAALAGIDSPELRQASTSYVANGWWEQDKEDAVAWVRDGLEGQAQQVAYGSLLEEKLGKVDFDENFELFKEMADGSPDTKGVHGRFASAWARRDPQAAAEWAMAGSGFPDGGEVLKQVARQWASSDPKGLERFSAGVVSDEMKATLAGELRKAEERQQ